MDVYESLAFHGCSYVFLTMIKPLFVLSSNVVIIFFLFHHIFTEAEICIFFLEIVVQLGFCIRKHKLSRKKEVP